MSYDEKIESMVLADEPCPDCGSRHHRSCESISRIVVGVCREDNPRDVDDAYGAGTYARLFPKCELCLDVFVDKEGDFCSECQEIITADGRSKDPAHGRE
jgi:hypothetical protein